MFGRLTRELARQRRLVSILELVDYYLLKWNLSPNSDNKVEPTGLPVMRLRPMKYMSAVLDTCQNQHRYARFAKFTPLQSYLASLRFAMIRTKHNKHATIDLSAQ